MSTNASGLLIGDSKVMREVRDTIARVAPFQVPVGFVGESGTGKGEAARMLHDLSGRKGPFVEVCAPRLNSGIAESTLYGHERGSFTGAVKDSAGAWRRADGGSCFLNELHRLGKKAQGLWLELLDGRPYMAVGGDRSVQPSVRLILGSSLSLRALHLKGMDEHLLFRLGAIWAVLPPLRDHLEDLPQLLRHCAELLKRKGIPVKEWLPDALSLLQESRWPGNIRQLFSVVEACNILARSNTVDAPLVAKVLNEQIGELSPSDQNELTLRLFQECGSKSRVAQILGVSTKTIGRRLGARTVGESSNSLPSPVG